MKFKGLELVWYNVADLKPSEYNPRQITDEQYEKLKKAIVKNRKCDPLKVNTHKTRKNILIGGHQRLEVLKDLGVKKVQCIEECLTLEEEKVRNLQDNKLGGSFDFDKLIDNFGVDLMFEGGFDEVEVEAMGFEIDNDFDEVVFEEDEESGGVSEVNDFDEVVDVNVKTGQVWKMGKHLIMCGDATDKKVVSKLFEKELAYLVFTDPPYGMKKEKEGVENDNLNFDDLLDFNKKWIPLSFDILTDVGSWYCWGIDEPLMDIYSEILKPKIKAKELAFRNLITWNKGASTGQKSEKMRQYVVADEKCLFVMKGTRGIVKDKTTFYEGYEQFRSYYDKEAKKMKWTRKKVAELTNTYSDHYFRKSQYSFPTQEHHEILQKEANGKAFNVDYSEFKERFEKEKSKMISERSYFDNVHDNMNSVWHFGRTKPTERVDTGGHATPKPIEL